MTKPAARGEKHYNARLTTDDVRLIRELVDHRNELIAESRKLSDAKIAEKFGVHKNTIWKIASYAGWGHVR